MKINIKKYSKKKLTKEPYIRIDAWDTWNMDNTLAIIILPMLIQLKETKHGIPSQFCLDGESWTVGETKWNAVLDKMIWSFSEIVNHSLDFKLDFKDKSDYLKHQETVDEGLALFGKHFRDLWD
jgi:hypothetical protein